jgi:hypothetical protein
MTKLSGIVLAPLIGAVLLVHAQLFEPVQAQQTQLNSPTTSSRVSTPTEGILRGVASTIVSPEIFTDRRVTFRFYAPAAHDVYVTGEFRSGAIFPMTKNNDGVWSVVTDPIAPEQYFYTFHVDGATIIDPRNPRLNMLVVPGPRSSAFEVREVPQGYIRLVWYQSSVTKKQRRIFVYPPLRLPHHQERCNCLVVTSLNEESRPQCARTKTAELVLQFAPTDVQLLRICSQDGNSVSEVSRGVSLC